MKEYKNDKDENNKSNSTNRSKYSFDYNSMMQQKSQTKKYKANNDEGSAVAGFLLSLFLGPLGMIFAFAFSKKGSRTRKGVIYFLIFFLCVFIFTMLYLLISSSNNPTSDSYFKAFLFNN